MHDYVIRMDANSLPPANAFWSVTLYDIENGFSLPNDSNLSGTIRVHRKMRVAGVDSDLHVYEGVSHGEYSLDSPERDQVFGELGEFLFGDLR